MSLRIVSFVLAMIAFGSGLACAQNAPGGGASPGEQLYSTHCLSCHSSQVHWRDKRIAKDWPGLVAQVRRWESNVGLGWPDEDILDVARYLNARYYHFAEPAKRASLPAPAS
ncbi:MAG TPA: hypothetical protein VMN79_15565 [Casimicrobiaceae bacterium]|nr:hypothetical protein [Casimicrobiaceae bacterium]